MTQKINLKLKRGTQKRFLLKFFENCKFDFCITSADSRKEEQRKL
jgi:hypothetical protein